MVSVLGGLHARFTVLWFLAYHKVSLGTGIPLSELGTGIPHCLSVHSWIQPSAGPQWESGAVELLQDWVIWPVVPCPWMGEVQMLVAVVQILVVAAGTFMRLGILLLSPPVQLYFPAWEPALHVWVGVQCYMGHVGLFKECSFFQRDVVCRVKERDLQNILPFEFH